MKKIEIRNRWSDKVIFISETATTIKDAVIEAVTKKVDLSEADLSEVDLSETNLSEANLFAADLSAANLSEANLFKANLSEANLFKADLFKANLFKADLSEADLSETNLLFCRMDEKVFKQITEGWFKWKIVGDEQREGEGMSEEKTLTVFTTTIRADGSTERVESREATEQDLKELGWVKADSESLIKAIGADNCKLCLFEPKTCGYAVESRCEGFMPKSMKSDWGCQGDVGETREVSRVALVRL